LVNFYQTTRCYNPEDSNLQLILSLYNDAVSTAEAIQLSVRWEDDHK
jgi:hypothetical protein